jgi:hypothetical protein
METVYFSETLVSTYESTLRHNPEEHRQLQKMVLNDELGAVAAF